jgi:RNA polymerase sigma factor (sigma-70 family)
MSAAPSFVCRLTLCPTDRAWELVEGLAKAEARTASGSGLDAGDLESIGAVALLESVRRLEVGREQTFDAFVIERVRGAMRNAIRRARTRSAARAGEAGALAMISAFAEAEAAGPRDAHDAALLANLFGTLPEDEAHVVRAFDLEDRSMADVARELSVSTPTAWRARCRALDRMRDALSDDRPTRAGNSRTIGACLEGREIPTRTRTPRSGATCPRASRGSALATRSRRGTR